MSLQEIREEIDRKDALLLKLLNDRMELALMSKKFKAEIHDDSRESEVLEKIKRNSRQLIDSGFCEKLFLDIMKESKKLQGQDFKLIAFQGEHGAYSQVAANTWDADYVPIPCSEFADIFEGLKNGKFDYGIIPIENSLGGVVGEANDLLIHSDLHVVGAVELPIRHCLLTLPGADHREIRSVYSHSQALAQCRHFLARNHLDAVPYYDTAGSAKMLNEERPKAAACIASALCADLYDLEIMKEGVEDLETNTTRFLLLSQTRLEEAGTKCSILFTTAHKAGTLFKVLELFAKEQLNLTRIESIPSTPGNYTFFLDFMGSDTDELVQKVLQAVQKETREYKFMGCYNERKLT